MADEYYSGAYTGAEIDAAIAAANAAAPQETTYTKNEVDTALAAKADKGVVGLKLVLSRTVGSSTAVTYAMDMNDFIETSPTIAGSIGTYIISVMPWSTSPNFSLYSVSYTGGSFSYTSITKIAGADRTITVENGVISVSGLPSNGGKVSIHALL